MTNAGAVARTLKRAGINTVPTRLRDGIYVTGQGRVSLTIQHDLPGAMPGWARRLKDSALEVLREAGYTVVPADSDENCERFDVTKDTA